MAAIDMGDGEWLMGDGEWSLENSGVDLSSKMYAFETPDGTLGLVAKVDDSDAVTDMFVKLAGEGKCSKPEERRGARFVMIKDSWLAGYTDDAMVVIGPVSLMERTATEQKMLKMFAQDENHGAKNSRIFQTLDTLDAPVTLVAQASALPEQAVLPFTIGAPKEADASQIMLSAKINKEDELLVIRGKTFSYNEGIDKKLKENDKVFRPVTDDMLGRLSPRSMGFLFMNVNGEDFLKVLQQNRGFQALLAGANTAIDMDNILRSVDGDIVFSLSNLNGDFDLMARLAKKDFLKDVGYWKTSCPAGSTITDAGKDAYLYKNGDMRFSFAVTPDNLFVSSLRHGEVQAEVDTALKLTDGVLSKVKGSRLTMLVDLDKIDNKAVAEIIKPILGGKNKILYIKE
jgi:hypothetical protein